VWFLSCWFWLLPWRLSGVGLNGLDETTIMNAEKAVQLGGLNFLLCKEEEMMLTGAQIVWEMLQHEGVDVIFGMPGGGSCRRTTLDRTTGYATC